CDVIRTERDVSGWSSECLRQLLLSVRVEGPEGACQLTDLDQLEGEASINNRKGKLFFFYEWTLRASWLGTASSGVKYRGNVHVSNLSDENDEDDLDISVSLCKDHPDTPLLGLMRTRGVQEVRRVLGQYVQQLKSEFSQGMILPSNGQQKTSPPQVDPRTTSVCLLQTSPPQVDPQTTSVCLLQTSPPQVDPQTTHAFLLQTSQPQVDPQTTPKLHLYVSSRPVLFRELTDRQTALRHFIHYLTESNDQRLLLDLLRSLGRTEDVALLQYKAHLSIADENKRRDFLKSCLSLPFSPEDSAHVQDHYTLLERQIIIEATDRQAERGGKQEIFQKFPRKASILNMPLITTLYYCCFYHYAESEVRNTPSQRYVTRRVTGS
ncbi:uncharacterized protein LOC117941263, partial [Etheostoma cragini]|uniref:uncharacterized protein LOC117941263 n=1 Tax=Etheostoma cragini TaxID=417921 RepID=UPI00155EDF68